MKVAFRWVVPNSWPLDFLQLPCSGVQHLTLEERPTEDTSTQWYRFDARDRRTPTRIHLENQHREAGMKFVKFPISEAE